ncbi:MAG: transporter substrate-binding domain-containing protein, partial [Actinobacteria bacterium]|nr:transporter substrate-binding domain-containing protein [Actinomycetota bacterium]
MRVRKILVVFAAFAILVAACGDDDTTTTTTTETTEAPTTTEAPATTEAMGLQTLEPGILTVGSDISWPPFEEYVDGVVVGFDADLVNEIGSRLGLETVWKDTSFDTIFTNLAQGQFDIVASGATITAERAQQVNFSDGYFNSNQALTVNANETPDILALADLSAGDSVAVQTGTTGAAWATDNLAPLGIEVREFPQAPDTYNALEGGQVTGVIFDVDSAIEEASNREGLAVVAEIPTGELYGIAVNPENEELLTAINGALAAMVADGTYQTIYDTWFDKPEGSINYVPELPTGGEPTASGLVTLEEECATYGGLTAPEGFRVNLVTDIGKVDDGTFNQFAYDGMQGALTCFGITESDYIETASEADYAANIGTSLTQEPDVMVTVGFLLT